MSVKDFAKQVLVELADSPSLRAARARTARRIAKAIAEIDPAGLTAEQMQRLAVEAAESQGAPL
jgi:hypothetical protein